MPSANLVELRLEVHLETVGLPVKASPVPSVRRETAREYLEIFRKASQAPQMVLRALAL